MNIVTETIEYTLDGREFEASLSWDSDIEGERPGVLLGHAWAGRSGFENERAERVAALGYTAMALDVYGKGILGSNPEENAALMQPLLDNRAELLKRLRESMRVLKNCEHVDASRTAIMGYCFGGLCALDLARSGDEFAAAISIHGLFTAPPGTGQSIKAKVLALHGWDDPMALPESVLDLAKEMSGAGADWQLHAYGGTLHAFTNPAAQNAEAGTLYSQIADQRSWAAITEFLRESFQIG